jgi:hypothetical protein
MNAEIHPEREPTCVTGARTIMLRPAANLRRAFLVTVTASACSSTMISNPPACEPGDEDCASCPAAMPDSGADCPELGLQCEYQDDCGWPLSATCGDGGWDLELGGTCNPPPPCPLELPVHGESCADELTAGGPPIDCPYSVATACGVVDALASCVLDDATQELRWSVVLPECHAPPELCQEYDHPSACTADTGCRWLVPGCADEGGAMPVAEGCYPVDDCSQTGCGTWGSCETVVYDPCAGSLCNACAGEASVCVPSS